MQIKNPFFVIKNFISPLECEKILIQLDDSIPNYTAKDIPLKTIIKKPIIESRIWDKLEIYSASIEQYYNMIIKSISSVDIELYAENCQQEEQRCENSAYHASKWRIKNSYDFTCILFLKDYNESPDFDDIFECYGGKLNMVNHGFSFNPNRGQLIIFPSNQYFINYTQSPKLCDFFQMRFHLICEKRWPYDRNNFSGNYKVWFK